MRQRYHIIIYAFLLAAIAILAFQLSRKPHPVQNVTRVTRYTVLQTHEGMVSATELNCLAQNIYFEAANQPYAGKMMVGLVVIARLNSQHYPNTICGIVFQGLRWHGKEIRDKCQFSWTCDGIKHVVDLGNPIDKKAWDASMSIAAILITNRSSIHADELTHYHEVSVKPYWAKTMVPVMQVGRHLFYAARNSDAALASM